MAAHKKIDRICCAVLILSLLVTVLFMNGEALGLSAKAAALGYETRLFDTAKVHTIDIVMDDWEDFISSCEDEEYSPCAVIIDGESYKNVAIRAKGNTSLSSVRQLGSQRYSFKLEFDHYDSGKTYHGLDKLCLNNLIQDNTTLKDYLVYRLMGNFGVASPLCSFVYITVNGEDWGLYLAVEGVEDTFLERNYGSGAGELYKPDSMSFGGGRGNGKEFDMDDFDFDDADFDPSDFENNAGQMPDFGDFSPGVFSDSGPGDFQPPSDDAADAPPEKPDGAPDDADRDSARQRPDMPGGFGGMGSNDVKLSYIDGDPDSYANIFENAKTDVSEKDEARLIESLKKLSSYEDLENVLEIDAVLRYFVVHNFVVNGDSYTGSMIHNYYLYEQDGKLSMLPWDYNLAFGGFQSNDATASVNAPIDDVLTDRQMQAWIFSSEEYTRLYHEYYAELLQSADIQSLIDEAYSLIAPYVAKDPTKFCTFEEFELGVETLKTYCALRTESVQGQLDGSVPSTSEAQKENSERLVDASSITLSDMGSMGNTMRGGDSRGFETGDFEPPEKPGSGASSSDPAPATTENTPQTDAAPQTGTDDASQASDRPAPPDGQAGAQSADSSAIVLTAACAAALLLGIGFAAWYKKR